MLRKSGFSSASPVFPHASASALLARLDAMLAVDAHRLRRRIEKAGTSPTSPQVLAHLQQAIEAAEAKFAARRANVPAVAFPHELPVSARAEEIANAICANPVVIVCGETGSGKTTQLPKICLLAGRGLRGLIGHTQPRRIAARAVASRIAHELGSRVGESVGFKVRFTDHTRPEAYLKVMTDGILLAETQRDRELLQYDTIIIDEAHERSLNIDFLLGYLKQLSSRRPDLKLVITSATLDAQRFAEHFGDGNTAAPVIEVSGRTFPVEVRYRPLGAKDDIASDEADDEEALEDAIVDTAESLWREAPGDMLVFLPGEREIRETADLARRSFARRPYAQSVEILPLYSRLSVEEQQRIFAPSNGRRIVLATNVAETSITVPGIRYVIDTGLARIKRYNARNKTTLLAIEKISQASAQQRAGRSGRVQNGVCVRLYGDADLLARPRYTDPEILRSSLASVILRMAALDLGPVAAFPFVEPPTPRAVADGYQLLGELGAVDATNAVTDIGRELARLPLDPRLARIVIAARATGCLPEALIIAAALSVPDPRERPLDRQQAADQAHLKFRDERSDFASLVALWEGFGELRAQRLAHRRLVDACRAQFINFLRLTEWRDVHRQLASELAEAGWTWDDTLPKTFDAARYALLHKALLAGLVANVGMRSDDGDGYLGTRGLRFHVHPSSGLAKKPPRWVVAAELVETTRLFARCVGRIEPEWIEDVAGDRVTRTYFDARFDGARGEVVAAERVQLYGLTVNTRRAVSFGSKDPAVARQIFIHEGLVEGRLATPAAFLKHNAALVADVAKLEDKARRQDVLVDPEALAALYAERIPEGVHSSATFERWRKNVEKRAPRHLHFTRDEVMRHAASTITEALYPETLRMAGADLPVKYRFAPSHPLDGVTLTVPLALLNQVDDARLSWLVPGMVREKVTAYLKALPKHVRNRLNPLPPFVTAFLEDAARDETSLQEALRAWLNARLSTTVSRDVFDNAPLPAHLSFNVRVVDAASDELAMGRDVEALRAQLGEAAQLSFGQVAPTFEREGLTRWSFGDVPVSLTVTRGGRKITGFPALVDDGDSVSLKLFDTADAAEASHRAGVVRLIRLALPKRAKPDALAPQALAAFKGAVEPKRLAEDLSDAIDDRAFIGDDPLPRSEPAFTEQLKRAKARLPAVTEGAQRLFSSIATAYQALNAHLAAVPTAHSRFAADIRGQRDALIHPGFLVDTRWTNLQHVPRYLKGLERRVERKLERPDRDDIHAARVDSLIQRHRERLERNRTAGRHEPKLDAFRWLIEELKISLFAQELKTPFPVSYKRLESAWQDLDR
ncbi:MAG TPA: ATP-dependent RNA helicase HrpA [Casimicrobiaceae bacterium]|nr:ATP-dependent RNA helicase HrpA [Casimicrobiaceae bacterium]